MSSNNRRIRVQADRFLKGDEPFVSWGFNYCDTGNEEPARNVWSRMGIVDRQGAPKPAQACFVRYARSTEPPADFHPTPLPYDPSHYRHAVQAIGERFAASR